MARERALVLSGGSIKGSFQAGAVSHVLKCFDPDLVIGTSVGSLNGGFIVARHGAGNSWRESGEKLTEFWKSRIRRFRDIGRRRCTLSLLLSLRKRFNGILDMSRLYSIVAEEVKREEIAASVADFYACSVNIQSGQAHYAGKDSADLIDSIIASTAIPLVMPIRMVGGEPYWDGGIREVAPLKKAIELGANEIVCIACDPPDTPPASIPGPTGPFMELADRLMQMVTNETLNNDIDTVHDVNHYLAASPNPTGLLATRRHIELTVIRPAEELQIDLESFDEGDISRLIDLGVQAAEREWSCG